MQPGRSAFIAIVLCGLCAVPAHAGTIHVDVDKLVFAPADINAKVGDTVEWDNRDFFQHTATATTGDWNIMLPPHKKGSIVVNKAGTYDYFCKFHPNMKGKVTVTP